MRAGAAGGFNRTTSHFVDQTRQLDEQGWDDVAKLLHKLYDDLDKVEQESLARLESDGGAEAITAGFLIAFFDSLAGADKPDRQAGDAAPARGKRAKAGA
jgi:hypothetical protein